MADNDTNASEVLRLQGELAEERRRTGELEALLRADDAGENCSVEFPRAADWESKPCPWKPTCWRHRVLAALASSPSGGTER